MQVPSFPDDIAMALIEEELGKPWQEVYSELSPSPIAAGEDWHSDLELAGIFGFPFSSGLPLLSHWSSVCCTSLEKSYYNNTLNLA